MGCPFSRVDRHRHRPDQLLEHDPRALARERDLADRRQHVRRAHRRVAGEWQLGAGGEDPHAPGVRLIGRRVDERRLRKVELACDVLQPVLGDAAGVGEDRERIAAERLIGEDVGGQVAEPWHARKCSGPGYRGVQGMGPKVCLLRGARLPMFADEEPHTVGADLARRRSLRFPDPQLRVGHMRTYFALALLVCVGSPLAAQQASGRIEGQITDSVQVSPLANAMVTATRVGAANETTFVARTDRRGRFRFESIDAGRYAMRFVSPLLDSLQYGGNSPIVEVTLGARGAHRPRRALGEDVAGAGVSGGRRSPPAPVRCSASSPTPRRTSHSREPRSPWRGATSPSTRRTRSWRTTARRRSPWMRPGSTGCAGCPRTIRCSFRCSTRGARARCCA